MLLKPGTILIAALSYYARLLVALLLGVITILAIFSPDTFIETNIIIALTTCLLVYFAMSSCELTQQRINELTQHLKFFEDKGVVNLSYNDPEFNTLAHHINTLLRVINRKEHLLHSCSQETRYTATELQSASNVVADGAQEELLALNALVLTSKEMNKMIENIQASINSTSEMASLTRQQSEEGQTALNNLKQQVHVVQSKVTDNQAQLIKTAQDISEFVTTIEKITSQINLLSLNASIEAARAGDAGRGFAVVASEIRLLAENTENTAQDIGRLVESIASEVNTSGQDSLKLIELATNAATDSDTAAASLLSIHNAAQSTQKEINHSTRLITEFGIANTKMGERLHNIAVVSEQHSQASKDTKDMVKYMEWLSSRLEQKEVEV